MKDKGIKGTNGDRFLFHKNTLTQPVAGGRIESIEGHIQGERSVI